MTECNRRYMRKGIKRDMKDVIEELILGIMKEKEGGNTLKDREEE